MTNSPTKRIWAGALSALIALFAAVIVATPAYAEAPAATQTTAQQVADVLNYNGADKPALNNAVAVTPTQVTLNSGAQVQLQAPLAIDLASVEDDAITNLTINLNGGSITATSSTNTISITSGTITLENGTLNQTGITPAQVANTSEGVYGATPANVGATLQVNGGTVNLNSMTVNSGPAGSGDTGNTAIENASLAVAAGTVNVNSGTTIKSTMATAAVGLTGNGAGGTVIVTNATITGGGVKVYSNACVKVFKGTFTAGKGAVIDVTAANGACGAITAVGGTVNVLDGATVSSAEGKGISTIGGAKYANHPATINILGGVVHGGATGLYLPTNNGTTPPNTVNVSGGAVSGMAGIITFGSNVNVSGGTITATGSEPETVGDSGIYFPCGALVSCTATTNPSNGDYQQNGDMTYAAAGTISITGGEFVAEEGEPVVIATNGATTEDGTSEPFSGNAKVTISGTTSKYPSFSSTVENSYLASSNNKWIANNDGMLSYWGSDREAKKISNDITEIGAVEIVSTGFAAVDADTAMNAAWTAEGGTAIEKAPETNVMWAIIEGTPNTQYNVYFCAPLAADVDLPAGYIFAETVSTNASGKALVYCQFANEGATTTGTIVNDDALTAGAWIVGASQTVDGTLSAITQTTTTNGAATAWGSSSAPQSPFADNFKGIVAQENIDLASVTYQLQTGGTWADDAQGNDDVPEGAVGTAPTYSLYYDLATTTSAELVTTAVTNTNTNYIYVGFYENTAAATAPANYQPAPATIALTEAEDYPVVAVYVTNAELTVTPASTVQPALTVVAGQQVPYELTLALPARPVTVPSGVTVSTSAFNAAAPAVLKTATGTISGTTATVTPGTAKVGEDGVTLPVTIKAPAAADGNQPVVFTVGGKTANAQAMTIYTMGDTQVITVGNGTYAASTTNGKDFTLTALPAQGATFKNWVLTYNIGVNGQAVSADNPAVTETVTSATLSLTEDQISKLASVTAYFEGGWAPAPETVPVYRLYNPYTGEHLFTTDTSEQATLLRLGWLDEDVAWNAPTEGTPVYRLFNKWNQDHYYTTDATERDGLVELGWTVDFEGAPAFYSVTNGTIPVYQLFNPYETAGTHLWTTDVTEYNDQADLGWVKENAVFFAASLPE